MKRTTKPPPVDDLCVNAAVPALLQVIDTSGRKLKWKTIGRCVDTPVRINAELSRLGNPKSVWIKTEYERRPLNF